MIDFIARRLATMASTNAAAALKSSQTTAIIPTLAGAIGQGATPAADQAGFQAAITSVANSISNAPLGVFGALEYQTGMIIEPGIYDAGGFTLHQGSVRVVARIPGTVIIRIPAGQYFITHTGQPSTVMIDGIMFIGGKGCYKSTYTGSNAINMCQFTRNTFVNYTECAVSNSSTDSPFLKFKDNFVGGAAGTDTIGVAWGGYLDQVVIADNNFGPNSYHVAIGPRLGGSAHILRNDFIGQNSTTTLADIWIKPNITEAGDTNGGQGILIEANKFGAEGQAAGSPRILVANENTAAGGDRATYRPATNDAGFASGFSILHNRIASIANPGAPFIRSYVSNLRGWSMRDNHWVGGNYSHVFQWPNGRIGNYTNTSSDCEFSEADGAVPVAFSTHPFGHMRDYACFWPGDPSAVPVFPVSDNPSFQLLASALTFSARAALAATTKNRAADPCGGMEFSTLTAITSAGCGEVIGLGAATMGTGGPIFVELALSRAASNSLSRVTVDIFNPTDGATAFRREITLASKVARFMQPVHLPPHANPGAWQLRVYATSALVGSADSFVTGNWIVNSGNGRLGRIASNKSMLQDTANIRVTPGYVRKFRSKIADVLAGTGNARVLILGDSTVAGCGGGTSSGDGYKYVGAFPNSFPSQMAGLSSKLAISSPLNRFVGGQNVEGSGNGALITYDTRFATTGAVVNYQAKCIGGDCPSWTANSAGTLTFTPKDPFDRVRIHYISYGGTNAVGTVTTNDGTTIATLNGAQATALRNTGDISLGSMQTSLTITVPPSTHTGLPIIMIDTWDSAKKQVMIYQGGWSGGVIQNMYNNVNIWEAGYQFAPYAFDLVICNGLILNDVTAGTTAANWATYFNTLHDYVVNSGSDMAFISGLNTEGGTAAQWATGKALVAQSRTSCAAKNVPLLEFEQEWRPYAGFTANYWNWQHPNTTGYAAQARMVIRYLEALAGV